MKDLKLKLDEFLKEKEYNGAVLLAKNNEIILEAAYGLANVEHQVPNMIDTAFRIASITKEFTAAGMLKLIEMGRAGLYDRIDVYIPEYKHANKLTIHHLLSNTAGIPNPSIKADYYDVFQNEKYLLPLILMVNDQDLLFRPGDAFYYSTTGFLMLQYIIEKLSDMDFDQFLKQYLFKPIGMNHTEMETPSKIIPKKAYGYQWKEDKLVLSDYIDMRIAGGGGGAVSTVGDLFKWNMSLLNATALDRSSCESIFTTHIQADEQNSYGYGMIIGKGNFFGKNRIRFYHTGGGPGVRAFNVMYPDEGVHVILISNFEEREKFEEVSNEMQKLLLK